MKSRIHAKDPSQRKLIVSALLSAITVILFFLSNVPVLNFAGILLCPVPLTLISFVYGFSYGFLSMVVSCFLVFLSLGLVQAYFYLSIFGFLSVVTGVMTRIFLEPFRVGIYSIILILLFNLFFYYGVEKLFGLEDMINQFKVMVMGGVDWIFQNLGFLSEGLNTLAVQYINILIEVPLMLFFLISFAMFYLNFFASGYIFKRFSVPFPELPPLPLWKIPRELSFLFLISALLCMFTRNIEPKWIFYSLVNLFSVSYVSLFFLGYSMIVFLLAQSRIGLLKRLLMLPFILLLNFIPVVIAIADSFANWRKL